MSNIQGRDDFRHTSVTASECLGQISGMGKNSYKIAMEAFKQMIEEGHLQKALMQCHAAVMASTLFTGSLIEKANGEG